MSDTPTLANLLIPPPVSYHLCANGGRRHVALPRDTVTALYLGMTLAYMEVAAAERAGDPHRVLVAEQVLRSFNARLMQGL